MIRTRIAAAMLVCALGVSIAGPARADDKKSKEYKKGQAFCPQSMLAVGNVRVQPGRCYMLAVLRDGRGTFLVFLHPSAKLPGAAVVGLSSEQGRKAKAKLIYLVPIQATGLSVVAIPVNTIQLIQIRQDHHDDDDDDDDDRWKTGDKVVLIITGMPVPNLSVTFVVRF